MMQGPDKIAYRMPASACVKICTAGVKLTLATPIWLWAALNTVSMAVDPALAADATLMDTLDIGRRNLISAGNCGRVPSRLLALQFQARKFGSLKPLTPKLAHLLSTAPSPSKKWL